MSWDDAFLGARASRPHKAWHSFAQLPDFDQPGTAPWLSFRLADAAPADRVAACRMALKFKGRRRANAAGCQQRPWPGWRPEASPGSPVHLTENPVQGGWGWDWRGRARWQGQDAGGTPALPGDAVRLRGAGGAWRATSQEFDVHPHAAYWSYSVEA